MSLKGLQVCRATAHNRMLSKATHTLIRPAVAYSADVADVLPVIAGCGAVILNKFCSSHSQQLSQQHVRSVLARHHDLCIMVNFQLGFLFHPGLLLCSQLRLYVCVCLFGLICVLLQAVHIGSEGFVVQLCLVTQTQTVRAQRYSILSSRNSAVPSDIQLCALTCVVALAAQGWLHMFTTLYFLHIAHDWNGCSSLCSMQWLH